MKHTVLPLIAILLCLGCEESTTEYEEIDAPHAIPVLTSDFGKVIEIEGQIVEAHKKIDTGKKLISIRIVEGKKLDKPIVMPLHVFSHNSIKLPVSGEKVRLKGYETGGFIGIPEEAFDDIPRVATTSHHFSHSFQVIKLFKSP